MPRPTLQGTQTPFKSSKSTSSDSAKDNTTRGARLPSELMLFLNTSQLLFRRTPSWWTRPNLGWTCGAQDKSSDTSKDAPPELATRAWRVIHHSYNSYIKKRPDGQAANLLHHFVVHPMVDGLSVEKKHGLDVPTFGHWWAVNIHTHLKKSPSVCLCPNRSCSQPSMAYQHHHPSQTCGNAATSKVL